MNGLVSALGTYVSPLTERALHAAEKIGVVSVSFGDIACQVPFAPDAIRKAQPSGSVGKKRRTAK